MKRSDLAAFVAGLLFAVGLGISGMTQPQKVISFLDVGGAWDPSLAFVMLGAVGVHFGFAQRAKHAARPVFAASFERSPVTQVDGGLLLGAALFGLGWGASGFCPGPALVSLVTLAPGALTFVAAMLVGMLGVGLLRARRAAGADSSPA